MEVSGHLSEAKWHITAEELALCDGGVDRGSEAPVQRLYERAPGGIAGCSVMPAALL